MFSNAANYIYQTILYIYAQIGWSILSKGYLQMHCEYKLFVSVPSAIFNTDTC